MNDKSTGDTFTMSGDFRGAIVNIKSTLTNVSQTVGALPNADESAKDELKQLIQQLSQALEQAPPDKVEEAEAVAKSAELLVQTATEEKPNQTMVQITGEGLKQAAKNIAEVMPTVLTIATQIVTTVAKLAG
jgi:ABC-type transporter Mla subunit MlaD